MMDQDKAPESAFNFDGNWREFAPIAFTNLLLSVVTLGFYRFWAKTRERQYLWNRTHFIDERLEWTGNGKEMFVGFAMAAAIFFPLLLILQFGVQGLALRGHQALSVVVALIIYVLLLFIVGLARFRALRYRLSRSWWHGIRGGSDDQGVDYAKSYMWKTMAGIIPFGLLVPWSMTSLWNERWNAMSFGGTHFRANAQWQPIFMRALLTYGAIVALMIVAFGMIGASFATFATSGGPSPAAIFAIVALIAGIYFLLPLAAMIFYAGFLREAIGALELGDLRFRFTARSWDWVKLLLGNGALVIFTLGIGFIFLGYRNWAFFIRHLEASGEVDLRELEQSVTRNPGQGEGLLDAFDVGAI